MKNQSEMLERNKKIAQSIKEKIDVYHTCATQKEATIAFGIKPAFLQEVYQCLTGDASKSHASDEAEADTHIRLVLDCEDPGIVCDLTYPVAAVKHSGTCTFRLHVSDSVLVGNTSKCESNL